MKEGIVAVDDASAVGTGNSADDAAGLKNRADIPVRPAIDDNTVIAGVRFDAVSGNAADLGCSDHIAPEFTTNK